MALINVDKLYLGYDGENVVENLSFSVEKGDYLCIVGENGSGKSTLIKAIPGLKKPTSGKITYGDGLTKNKIGYLPQQTPAQKDFPASVYEVVLSGCLSDKKLFGIYTSADRRKALDNMAILGISNLKNKCYRNLSGGQQQKVLLARALCAAKSALLLDEPVTGLDPTASFEMYDLLYHLNRDHKITVIMVSHDINVSLKYATHILHVRKNDAFFGTTGGYMSSSFAKDFIKGEIDNG